MVRNNEIIISIDESGRGCLCGPVVASAVYIANQKKFSVGHRTFKITDSKQMTVRKREKVFEFLRGHPSVEWGIGKVGPKVIDKINIFRQFNI